MPNPCLRLSPSKKAITVKFNGIKYVISRYYLQRLLSNKLKFLYLTVLKTKEERKKEIINNNEKK